MPKGDKGGSRKTAGCDFELLDRFMTLFLRQTPEEQVYGKMSSVWTFRASGLTVCGQPASSEHVLRLQRRGVRRHGRGQRRKR